MPVSSESRDDGRQFAHHAIRLALEVLDRRRSPGQLRPMISDRMIEVVRARSRSPRSTGSAGAATLQRLRVQLQSNDTAEIFGTYTRGDRVFAYAARMERATVHAGRNPAWTITQLQLV